MIQKVHEIIDGPSYAYEYTYFKARRQIFGFRTERNYTLSSFVGAGKKTCLWGFATGSATEDGKRLDILDLGSRWIVKSKFSHDAAPIYNDYILSSREI